MSLIDIREEIKELINLFNEINVSRITPEASVSSSWNTLTNDEIQRIYLEVHGVLGEIIRDPSLLDTLGYNQIISIRNSLDSFVTSVKNYNTVPQDQITSHHHDALNHLNQLIVALSSVGLSTLVKLRPEIVEKLNKFSEVEDLINVLIDNKVNLEQATSQANEWIGARERVDQIALSGQAKAFSERAEENKPKGFFKRNIFGVGIWDFEPNWWLLMTFIMAGLLFSITWHLITFSQNQQVVGVGVALLRISSVLVPGYLTLFCANQFTYHKRLRDAYMFKYASLNTMNHLLSTRTQEQQAEILSKGLAVLFSEPAMKESSVKYDSQLVTEMLGIIKSQIK